MADTALAEQALRLTLAAELTRRAARSAGDRVAADMGEDDLLRLARELRPIAAPVERAHDLRLPGYPGVTAGVERAGGTLRLVLACVAQTPDGAATGVVFTALIAGRAPQVTVAPRAAPIPLAWRTLAAHEPPTR
jgi:hypothetical protein